MELLALGTGIALAGLKPAMTIGSAGSVTSSTVIQVVLPKPLISLVPLIVTGPVTIRAGCWVQVPPVVGVSVTKLPCWVPRISGARLMANWPRP